MRTPLSAIFTVLLVAVATIFSRASADIVEADFSGAAGGIAPYFDAQDNYFLNGFGTTFTAEFFFDLTSATIQETAPGSYQLTTPSATASFLLASIGGAPLYGNGPITLDYSGFGILEWQDSIGPTLAALPGDGYFSLVVTLNGSGSFQHGLCPDLFAPCGTTDATSSRFVGNVPVPGPVIGAGLPGLVLSAGAIIGWWRRKRNVARRSDGGALPVRFHTRARALA